MPVNKKYLKIGVAALAVASIIIGISVGLTHKNKNRNANSSFINAANAIYDVDGQDEYCSVTVSGKSGRSGGSNRRRALVVPGTQRTAESFGFKQVLPGTRRKLRDHILGMYYFISSSCFTVYINITLTTSNALLSSTPMYLHSSPRHHFITISYAYVLSSGAPCTTLLSHHHYIICAFVLSSDAPYTTYYSYLDNDIRLLKTKSSKACYCDSSSSSSKSGKSCCKEVTKSGKESVSKACKGVAAKAIKFCSAKSSKDDDYYYDDYYFPFPKSAKEAETSSTPPLIPTEEEPMPSPSPTQGGTTTVATGQTGSPTAASRPSV